MNKTLKNIFGWLHLWLGLATGLILITVALTGSMLTFENELEPVLFRTAHVVVPTGTRLPVDSLVSIAQAAFKNKKASRIIIPAQNNRSVEIRLGTKGAKGLSVAYINPYSGQILYKGAYNQRFFQQVRSLHRYLMLGATGKIITGISCSICFFLVISGIIIWWPANKKAIKQRFKIKWDASGKRLTWDLHAVTGFYLSIFLFVITLTGLVWSYDWIENTIYRLADGKLLKEAKIKNISKGKSSEAGIYQNMLQQVNIIYPGSGQVSFALPAKPTQAVTIQKESVGSIVPATDAAYFDSKTGGFIKKLPHDQLSTGAKIRKMILPVHTGSLLGWPTKVLALIVCLFTASLPITGFLMWLGKRKKAKKKGVRKVRAPKRAQPLEATL